MVETFFLRVKKFKFTVPSTSIRLIERAWTRALAATDLYAPLRTPVSWEDTQEATQLSKQRLVGELEAGGWLTPQPDREPTKHPGPARPLLERVVPSPES